MASDKSELKSCMLANEGLRKINDLLREELANAKSAALREAIVLVESEPQSCTQAMDTIRHMADEIEVGGTTATTRIGR
jgi:hypothetical protein